MPEVRRLHFRLPANAGTIQVDAGDRRTLCEILAGGGIHLNTRCGMRGLCRGCSVALEHGTVILDEAHITGPATIRACRAFPISGDVTIRVPAASLSGHRPVAISEFSIKVPFAHDPLFDAGECHIGLAADIGTTTVGPPA